MNTRCTNTTARIRNVLFAGLIAVSAAACATGGGVSASGRINQNSQASRASGQPTAVGTGIAHARQGRVRSRPAGENAHARGGASFTFGR